VPFSPNMTDIAGRLLSVRPEPGFGWPAVEDDRVIKELATPQPFDCEIRELLFDAGEARAIVCFLNLRLVERLFIWATFIPRTDLFIDIRERPIGCNILLSEAKPQISGEAAYPDPRHVWSTSRTHVRGFGRISLVG